jgi:hypothetical protein
MSAPSILGDYFVVYAQRADVRPERPDEAEQELASCATYAQANQIRQYQERSGVHCVIRFVGATGGGD